MLFADHLGYLQKYDGKFPQCTACQKSRRGHSRAYSKRSRDRTDVNRVLSQGDESGVSFSILASLVDAV